MAPRQARQEEPKAGAPAYIVSMSALWTILLSFFILMATMSTEQEAGLIAAGTGSFIQELRTCGLDGLLEGTRNVFALGSSRPNYGIDQDDIADEEPERTPPRSLKPDDKRLDDVRQLPKRVVVLPMPTTLHFAPGTAELDWRARRELNHLIRQIRHTRYSITIESYLDEQTSFDSVPDDPISGWELSARRARAVADYMHQRGGIPRHRLIPVGYSYHRPVSHERTDRVAIANDRLVVTIYAD